ncbi:Predicted protein [Taphrina deformans PYCC 5710]|uniref:Uncharacterized protein n=1 Tax=Taphrina deformans (strain PYCC 5710 / ATCC 11124 / CBS 356.35 / IMI 108563 / JCM 9778 / NBRC 8474) TaxID=1097556 RepID=R4XAK6_TAPDE|nr:Predicted protein [Taphrina deformans PYCC 5710]|eukprot:CCG82564.1 Predicted protein [Taphrina deformans PYCC 5710]
MSTTNYSLYTIPVAWVLSIAPHFYAASLANKVGKFDNTNPRNSTEKLKAKMSAAQLGMYQRAEAAQQNGFENIGLFAASVVAANVARVPVSTVNSLSLFYLASRVVYNLLYINTESLPISNVRSVVFVGGIVSIMTLFVKAGNALNLLL